MLRCKNRRKGTKKNAYVQTYAGLILSIFRKYFPLNLRICIICCNFAEK